MMPPTTTPLTPALSLQKEPPTETLQTTTTTTTAAATTTQFQHIPPHPFSLDNLTLLTQGAEALVYRTTYLTPTTHCALKYRPPKPYRHRTLDARLTRARILAEARVLAKCRRDAVAVPAVLALDWESGWLALEWVDGATVRRALDDWVKERGTAADAGAGAAVDAPEVMALMASIGRAVGGLHDSGVVHGDLTTSNLMLRPLPAGLDEGGQRRRKSLDGDIVLIDFGLAQVSVQEEDKAVDLYVLERAFASTHPYAEDAFKHVLTAYGTSYKGGKVVLKRLEDVRMRGRKKSMLG